MSRSAWPPRLRGTADGQARVAGAKSSRLLNNVIWPQRFRRALISTVWWAAILGGTVGVVSSVGSIPTKTTLVTFLTTAVLVIGLQMFIGNSGIISFGHVAFMGIGAYMAAVVTIPVAIRNQELPDLPHVFRLLHSGLAGSILLAAAVCAVLAGLLGVVLVRMRESAMAMATLAILIVGFDIFVNWTSVTRGAIGVYAVPALASPWVAAFSLILIIFVARFYRESRAGLRVQASREDPLPAASVGINVRRVRFTSWTLSAAVMGAGGALWAESVLAFDPSQFYWDYTFTTLAMLVIGGRLSVSGAVAGAGIITFLDDFLSPVESTGLSIGGVHLPAVKGFVLFTVAVMIIVVLIVRPEGLFGRWEIEEWASRVLRWKFTQRMIASFAPHGKRATGERPGPIGSPAAFSEPSGNNPASPPLNAGAAAARHGDVTLAVEGVTMTFEGLVALSTVELTLLSGEILGLIGPNGSGKTTLLNVVSGVLEPNEGAVALNGQRLDGLPVHQVAARGLARTFQNIRLFPNLTVEENVEVAATDRSSSRDVDEVLSWLELEPVRHELPSNLPYGQQRRVEIARAAIRRPNVMLLDEPAAGMNEVESSQLLTTIRHIQETLSCAIVVVDHDLRLIMALCDRIQVLDHGRTISEGAPEDVSADPRVIEAYLGRARAAKETPVDGDG